MAKKKGKNPKKKNNKSSFLSIIFIICVILGLIIASFIIFKTQIREKRHLPETEKNLTKQIPPDVKEHLAQQPIAASLRIPILMYHYIEYVQDKKDRTRQLLDTNPDVFEAQLQTLKDAGYTFMTAKDLGEVFDGKKALPKNPVLITIDDGHWDLDTSILPILRKLNVVATAYIIPGFIGGSDFLSANQLQDVVNSGLVDVGAHTIHHISLKGRSISEIDKEVVGSKQMLENEYHVKVVSFAYPYGSFDLNAINEVKKAGFTTAVSTIPGIAQSTQNRFFLYRIRPGYRTGENLLNFLKNNTFPEY